jgi:general stress protein YciG
MTEQQQHTRDAASDDGRRGYANGASSGTKRSGTSNRGFASMDRERQREIASKGGRAAHAKGTAHEWTADEARVAGRKGGETVSKDREHMAAIGREGGGARSAGARNRRRSENGETTVEDRSRISRSAPGDSASSNN